MNRLVPKVNMFIKALSWAPAKVKFRLLIRESFMIGIFINSNITKQFQNNNFFNKNKAEMHVFHISSTSHKCTVQMRASEGTEIA